MNGLPFSPVSVWGSLCPASSCSDDALYKSPAQPLANLLALAVFRVSTRLSLSGKATAKSTANAVPACRGAVEKKTVLENLDLVLLAMDEIIDGG